MRVVCLWVVLLVSLLAGCATPPQDAPIRPFTTDGCSMFPDRALIGNADWCQCCVVHDLAYWRGGTEEERQKADLALRACVRQSADSEALAALMFTGVRLGGGPRMYTPYRWGYGWPFGRDYKALTPDEAASADVLDKEYRAKNPALLCPTRPAQEHPAQ